MNKTVLYIPLLFLTILLSCKSKYRRAADKILKHTPQSTNMNLGGQNYMVDVPPGWTLSHQTIRDIDICFLAAPKTKEDPNTNMNILTEYMQNLSLEIYKAKTIESVKKSVPGAVILDEGDIEANGLKGGWYSYTMDVTGVKASLVSYIFPWHGIAYILTGGTQVEGAKRYRSTFDAIARSFRFKE